MAFFHFTLCISPYSLHADTRNYLPMKNWWNVLSLSWEWSRINIIIMVHAEVGHILWLLNVTMYFGTHVNCGESTAATCLVLGMRVRSYSGVQCSDNTQINCVNCVSSFLVPIPCTQWFSALLENMHHLYTVYIFRRERERICMIFKYVPISVKNVFAW